MEERGNIDTDDADEGIDYDSYRDRQSAHNREYLNAWVDFMKTASPEQRAAMREAGLMEASFDSMKDHLAALPSLSESDRAKERRRLQKKRMDEKRKHGGAGIVALTDDAASTAVDTLTPLDYLLAKTETAEEGGEDIELATWHFLLLGRFVCAGVEDVDTLKIRVLIVLRTMAPDVLADSFGIRAHQALRMEQKLRGAQAHYFRTVPYMPFSEFVTGERHEGEDMAAGEMGLSRMAFRALKIGQLCEKIAGKCRDLDIFVKTLASMYRRAKGDYIQGLGESQTDFGRKFDEVRATVQIREKTKIEEPLKEAGMKGFHLMGGTKTEEHRARCQKAQRGNDNRKAGKMRKAGVVAA